MLGEPGIGLGDQPLVEPLLRHPALVAGNQGGIPGTGEFRGFTGTGIYGDRGFTGTVYLIEELPVGSGSKVYRIGITAFLALLRPVRMIGAGN